MCQSSTDCRLASLDLLQHDLQQWLTVHWQRQHVDVVHSTQLIEHEPQAVEAAAARRRPDLDLDVGMKALFNFITQVPGK